MFFKWLKSMFSKPSSKRCLYKCTYVKSSRIEDKTVTFSLDDIQEMYVVADNALEAQVILAKKIAMSPYVCIHKIEKAVEVSS